MVSVVTITVKNEEKRLSKSFLSYDPYQVTDTDPYLNSCIKETVDEFKDEPEKVKIKITYEL